MADDDGWFRIFYVVFFKGFQLYKDAGKDPGQPLCPKVEGVLTMATDLMTLKNF